MEWIVLSAVILAVVIIDISLKLLPRRGTAFSFLLIFPHIVLIVKIIDLYLNRFLIPVKIFAIFLASWVFIRISFHVTPCRQKVDWRVRIMMGGRRIFMEALAAGFFQIPLCIAAAVFCSRWENSTELMMIDTAVVFTSLILLQINGAFRILATSRRLGIGKRILFFLLAWVPVVNILLGLWFCRIVKQEFRHEYQKAELQNARESSQICKTKYPLLMLHGIGFRDYKYINYWGRIPSLLIKNGALVYYGHQQAWGTIESNAEEIKQKIKEILKETDCGKVNIIAHSKGGLDARYLISTLGMADKVASLTTVSTPHRGSELLNILTKIPEKRYRKLSGMVDAYFRKLGDSAPDVYTSSRQLLPSFCKEFNQENPDAEGVFYQSYAAVMKDPGSHTLLSVPSALMKWIAGNNDGLVTVESAKWGEFKGTFKSRKHRGISHGDQIDLMRQDYEGFDMAEEYVTIVSDLKNKGF